MSNCLQDASLYRVGLQGDVCLYELKANLFRNRYFVLSSPDSTHLLASPEVVGYASYLALLPATSAALRFLLSEGL